MFHESFKYKKILVKSIKKKANDSFNVDTRVTSGARRKIRPNGPLTSILSIKVAINKILRILVHILGSFK